MIDRATSLELFIGRETELDRSGAAYQRGLAKRGGGFYLVSGPAGIGKTWFCQKFLERLSGQECFPLVLKHRFTGGEDLAAVCAGLLRQAVYQRPKDDLAGMLSPFQRSVLGAFLPDVVASPPGPAVTADVSAAAAAWRRWLGEIAGGEDFGLLLWVDDAQLADPPVWDWLAALSRQALAESLPLTVLVCLRLGADAADPGKAGVLAASLREEASFARSEFQCVDLALQPLDGRDLGRLLDRLFGAGFADGQPECARWLQARSGGNPFFAHLLIQAMVGDGSVRRDAGGGWRYVPPSQREQPASIDELVARRVMAALSEPALVGPVRLAVALGDAFPFDDWQQLTALPRADAIDTLLTLQRIGILSDFLIGNEHRVQFAHPLLLEAFRAILPDDEQHDDHQVAAAHYLATGRPIPALDHLIAAGGDAAALGPVVRCAVPEAFAQGSLLAVLAWAESITGIPPQDRAVLLLHAQRAAQIMGRARESLSFFERLAELREHLTPAQEVASRSSASRVLAAADPDRGLAVLDEGLQRCETGAVPAPQHRRELLLHKFYLLEETRRYQEAVAMVDGLLALDPGDGSFAFRVNNTLGMVFLRQGRWDDADRLYRDEVIPAARRAGEMSLGQALENHGAVLTRLCRFAEAEREFDQALEIAERYLQAANIGSVLNARGNIAMRQGRFDQALADKERAAAIAYTLDNRVLLASCLNDIAGIKMEMGRPDGVLELLHRSLRWKESLGNRAGSATTGTNIAICHLRGIGTPVDHAQALEWALRANAALRELDYTANMVDNLATISQAYLGLKQHDQALAYAEQAMDAAGRQATPYNRATALAQKGTVLHALGAAGAGGLLREAAGLFGSIDNRHEQANALSLLAEHLTARGEAGPAREVLQTVRGIYQEMGLDKALAALARRFPGLGGLEPQAVAIAGGGGPADILRIQTLGPFRIWPAGADQPLADRQWGSQLGRQIMAYLLTEGYGGRVGISREKLLREFWGRDSAGGSLRVLLHRLRRNLRCPDAVVYADDGYSFNWELAGVRFDREQMDEHHRKGIALAAEGRREEAREELERAEALFHGDYLDGFDEPWAARARRTLRATRRAILGKLIELCAALERPDAVAFYRNTLAKMKP